MDITIKDLTGKKKLNRCLQCDHLTGHNFICDDCFGKMHKKLNGEIKDGKIPSLNIFSATSNSISNSIVAHSELHDRKTHYGICSELNETYRKKNNDYGDSFKKSYDEFGIVSAIVRMSDKMERLKSLSGNTKMEVKDESLEDTILDLCNYGIMTVIEMRNRR